MERISNAPNLPGIYFLYNVRKKLIYIGQSQNIKKRFKHHIHNKRSYMRKQVEFFEYFVFYDEITRKKVEELLIRFINPFFNRTALDFRPWKPPESPTIQERYFKYGEFLIYYKHSFDSYTGFLNSGHKFERELIDWMRNKFGKKDLIEECNKINELYGKWSVAFLFDKMEQHK